MLTLWREHFRIRRLIHYSRCCRNIGRPTGEKHPQNTKTNKGGKETAHASVLFLIDRQGASHGYDLFSDGLVGRMEGKEGRARLGGPLNYRGYTSKHRICCPKTQMEPIR